jgi:cellulose synthase operon protein C
LIRAAVVLVALVLASPAFAALPLGKNLQAPPPGEREVLPPGVASALNALREGDLTTAHTAARAFVKAQPTSSLGHEVLGEAARRRGLWPEAERALTEALRLEPGRISALLRLGLVDLATQNFKQAEDRFRKAIAAVPALGDAHRGLGLALARQGKLAAAIAAMEQAVKTSRDGDVESKTILGGFYYDAGRPLDAERVLSEVAAVRPDHQAARLLQGIVTLDLGRTDEASTIFEQMALRDPRSLWARFGRAAVLRARGQLSQARAELEKVVKEDPDWSLAGMELGRTLLMQHQRDAAAKVFDEAERTSNDPGQARIRNSQVLLATGHAAEAITRAQTLLSNPGLAPAARDVIVRAHLRRQAPEQAELVLTEAVTALPQDVVARVQLGRFYLSRSRPKEALEQFDRASAIKPDAVDALRGQAEAHAVLNQPAEALAAAQKVVAALAETPESYLFLASVQQRAGRTPDAVQTLRDVLAKHPGHLPTLRALAAVYERDGQQPEAVKVLQQAATAHPGSPVPFMDLGALFQRLGQVDAAIGAYREGLRRAPDDSSLLNNLAYLLAGTPGALDEAATLAERAYKKFPRNPSIADTYGWILVERGAVPRGLALLEEAAKLAPANPLIRYHLGAAYARAGKRAEARRALEQALRGPAFADADAARKLLGSLQ